ncbi:uncharacterized protein LTR77_008670 [Saxophila tyrrhenica]|uniref:Myb-like domain-containing protein n=1 Tax=Saxophila tyrrhenica TaxID=1690608 RepID=A0AAV9P0Q1_9PEZI|nr:hypothetical protein LTR77_008670 [Saxophila tyrrhenica]
MSTGESYPNLAGQTLNAGSMADTSGLVASDWYTPSTVCTTSPSESSNDRPALDPFATTIANDWQYAYNESYMTPFPTTTMESQPWPQYARASIPDISVQPYTMHPPSYQLPQTLFSTKDLSRPRSSPSTFGPGAEHVSWPSTGGLGIYSSVAGHPTPPVTSTFPPSVFQQTYGSEEQYASSSTPEIRQPIPKRPFPALAPNPEQVAAQKRKRDEDEQQETTLSSSKKRKRTSSVASADLSEDDRFLVQLKEEESLPWKDIANRFQTDRGKNFQVAALQMRYKRLREKFRVWQDEDVKALKQAHEYWEKYKWEIIAQRMLDYGINERWPARHCARKWQDLETTAAASLASTVGSMPGLTHYSSPVENATHFTFMPMQ